MSSSLNTMSEDIRNQGYNSSSSGTDLVFDPITGEFKTIRKGSGSGTGEIVTKFTEEGFAMSELVVYLNEQTVKDFLAGQTDKKKTCGSYRSEENVLHLGVENEKISIDSNIQAWFYKSKSDLDMSLADEPNGGFAVVCEGNNVEVLQIFPIGSESVEKYRSIPFNYIPAKADLYSRAKGLLEVGVLKDKRVAIVGLGSFGSQIAIELAKAGVGSFSLFDFDRVEPHNLMRHTAYVKDLGRLKTDVLEESILGKNPYAHVDKFPVNINENVDLLSEELEKSDILICATDNNQSRFIISQALVAKQKVGIFGRAITRAEGGDVFRYRPGGPCYCCIVGSNFLFREEITNEDSARRVGVIPAYMSSEDAQAVVQVGLSNDIEPICNMMIRLALVELSRGTDSGISSLEEELVYDCYIWANRRDQNYSNWKKFHEAGPAPSILRWYGVRVSKDDNCPICSDNILLEE